MIGYQLTIRAGHDPHAIAVVFGTRRYTYAALNERACRLANGLATLGVGRGDRVATLLHNCNVCIEALFAAAKLGAVIVPINFRLVAREIALQFDACTPKAVLAGASFVEVLQSLRAHASFPQHIISVDDQIHDEAMPKTSDAYETWLSVQLPDEPQTAVVAEDVQMLMHSSGTTGLPKGVVFTHGTTLASCMAKIIDFGLNERDVTVVFGPLFHVGPLMDLALPLLLLGGAVVIGPSRHFQPARLLSTIAAERGTVIPIYPTMLRRVLAVPGREEFDLRALRLIITGGEPAPVPLIRAVHERFPGAAFVNNYGSTEGGPITTFLAPKDSLRKVGSVGKAAFSVEVRIVDDQDTPLPPNIVGQLIVRSPFVCRGYWKQPDATATS